jgi:hypothetical protein
LRLKYDRNPLMALGFLLAVAMQLNAVRKDLVHRADDVHDQMDERDISIAKEEESFLILKTAIWI